MANERRSADDPQEWLDRARSNLILAGNIIEGVYLDDLCFDAQQAAEKSIKAVFIANKIRFPFTHDIGKLLELLADGGVTIPKFVREAVILTDSATFGRYPGPKVMATTRSHARAVRIAEKVLRWAERKVAAK